MGRCYCTRCGKEGTGREPCECRGLPTYQDLKSENAELKGIVNTNLCPEHRIVSTNPYCAKCNEEEIAKLKEHICKLCPGSLAQCNIKCDKRKEEGFCDLAKALTKPTATQTEGLPKNGG